jgi:hypothetical protein
MPQLAAGRSNGENSYHCCLKGARDDGKFQFYPVGHGLKASGWDGSRSPEDLALAPDVVGRSYGKGR